MASMSLRSAERLRVLDAGAGAGALTAALVTKICSLQMRPTELFLTAYEVDGAYGRICAYTHRLRTLVLRIGNQF